MYGTENGKKKDGASTCRMYKHIRAGWKLMKIISIQMQMVQFKTKHSYHIQIASYNVSSIMSLFGGSIDCKSITT